jgi:hypothetical protein
MSIDTFIMAALGNAPFANLMDGNSMLTIDRTSSLKNNWSIETYEENPPKKEDQDQNED